MAQEISAEIRGYILEISARAIFNEIVQLMGMVLAVTRWIKCFKSGKVTVDIALAEAGLQVLLPLR